MRVSFSNNLNQFNFRMISRFSSLLILVALAGTANSALLDDCKTYAKRFRNTCSTAPDTAATWGSTFAGKTVSCTEMTACASSGSSAPNCVFTNKLCVTCTLESNKVYMRI